ncbi:MAG: ABC transporter permease [Candidatus Micrarchaeota archaeon]
MKYKDVAFLSVNNMRGRKLRAMLTVLGIVIAVASIIILISLANGVNQQVSSRLNQLGNDVIQITPGASRSIREGGGVFIGGGGGGFGGGGPPGGGGTFGGRINQGTNELKFSEAQDLKLIEGVIAVDARLQASKRASFKGRNSTVQIVGIDPSAFNQISTTTLLDGKLLNPNDRFSVVLGYRVHSATFGGEELLNRQIKIGDYSLRVVGLLNQTSGSLTTSDNVIYVPIEVAKAILNESENANQIFIKVAPGKSPDEVAAKIETKLLELHRLTADKADFTITTASFLQSTVSDVTNMLALFLGGIAAISLLVGAIGVANTMFMSVLERTREIGILKSLGMKDSEVTAMFLTEAAIIGLAGGMLGIILSLIVSQILAAFSVPSLITFDLALMALAFSGVVGIVSGALPARNAAKLQPVESLRYE